MPDLIEGLITLGEALNPVSNLIQVLAGAIAGALFVWRMLSKRTVSIKATIENQKKNIQFWKDKYAKEEKTLESICKSKIDNV